MTVQYGNMKIYGGFHKVQKQFIVQLRDSLQALLQGSALLTGTNMLVT